MATGDVSAPRRRSTDASGRRQHQGGAAALRTLGFLAPLAITALLFGLFYWSLKYQSDDLPSPLVGKPVPEFSLPPVQGRSGRALERRSRRRGLDRERVRLLGRAVPRRASTAHRASRAGYVVPINAINYKDEPGQAESVACRARRSLRAHRGRRRRRVGIDWGVYGVPETFVVDADGRVAYQHVGPLSSRRVLDETILPLVEWSFRQRGCRARGDAGAGREREDGGGALADEATR